MRRAALVCCLVVGVSVNGATQPQPVRACNPVFVGEFTAPPSVNFIDLDRDFDPLTIPRHFFREPPDYAVMYEVTGGKTSETGVVAVPLWKPGQEPIPVAVELPTRGGFVDADRQTVQLFEALKQAVKGSAVSRLVDSRLHAVVLSNNPIDAIPECLFFDRGLDFRSGSRKSR